LKRPKNIFKLLAFRRPGVGAGRTKIDRKYRKGLAGGAVVKNLGCNSGCGVKDLTCLVAISPHTTTREKPARHNEEPT